MQQTFTLTSPYDGLALSVLLFQPENPPKGIVQLVHGMCEHKERYVDFMQFLCDNGYVAICHDHRGHGDSVRSQADLGYFGDYDGKAVVDDAVFVTRHIKERFPNLPVTLFGHSMGSMVVRCYLRKHDTLVDKLIVSGSPAKNPLAGVAIGLEKCIRLFKGARHRSKLLAYLSTGKGDKNFPGEGKGAWLSQNRENVQAYLQNPKSNYKFTCNGFENLFKLMRRTYQKKGYLVQNPRLPIFFVSGADDPVALGEKKWREGIRFLQDIGYTQVTGKMYKGLRHEILNELKNQEVYADLLSFITK